MSRTLIAEPMPPAGVQPVSTKPRLGFVGVGWIGRNRLEAIARSGVAEIAAVADAIREPAEECARICPEAEIFSDFDELLDSDVDGIVIATPNALHADQAVRAIESGKAVFCQKPLGRNAAETRRVIDAARQANVLLGTDLSYRFITGIRKIRELCHSGGLGEIYAADLVFHNAYGPEKAWFYDWQLSGGGCVIDLGIHLVDLALWSLGFPQITKVTSRLFAQGKPIRGRCETVEDYAEAQMDLETGAVIRLACSWKLSAGCDAIISGSFYGTGGGAAFHNVDGSFYDFVSQRFEGTRREMLACSPELWGGRAAIAWARQLAGNSRFDSEIETLVPVARALDAVYENSRTPGKPDTQKGSRG